MADRFWSAVAAAAVLGLAIRLASVLTRGSQSAWGDAYAYHQLANLIVQGKPWINPAAYFLTPAHPQVPSAAFPPLYPAVLSLASLAGAKSWLAHRIWSCLIGAVAVPLAAVVGRQLAGRRVGVVAAFLMAVYPNIWMSDGLLMSETLTPIVVLLVLLTAYRFRQRSSKANAAWLGAALAVAALARDELIVLVVVVLVPLVLLTKVSYRRRLALLGAGVGVTALVLAPWVTWNNTRFSRPVFISTGFGETLAAASCKTAWNGPDTGSWDFNCTLADSTKVHGDEAAMDNGETSVALRYIGAHLTSLPRVLAAKEGRGFALYNPLQQIQQDHAELGRSVLFGYIGLGMYYALAVLSVGGVVLLRRRGTPVYPLLAIGLAVVIAMAVSWGETRYRTPFEVSLILLASVQLVDLSRRRSFRSEAGRSIGPEPVPAPLGSSTEAVTARGSLPPASGGGKNVVPWAERSDR